MKKKKSWNKKWYTDEFLQQLKNTERVKIDNGLEITEKYAPDAVSDIGIDPRLLGGPLGKNAKIMMLLPEFIIDKIKIKADKKTIESFRENSNKPASAVCVKSGIDIENTFVNDNNGYRIPIRIYKNKYCKTGSSCLYFMHGGAFIGGSISPYDEVWKVFVEKFNIPVISAEYRLMPENPYPIPHQDCYTVLKWIYNHADMLGIDKSHIFVAGDSAGGNLAQYCSTLAKKTDMVRGQILLYATLNIFKIEDKYFSKKGDFTYEPKQKRLSSRVTKQLEMMVNCFDTVFDVKEPDPYLNPYSFDASGNPPTLISVGALDYLKTENIAWAHKLYDAGVPVKTIVYNGMGHGYLNAMGVFPQSEDIVDEIGRFIKEYS